MRYECTYHIKISHVHIITKSFHVFASCPVVDQTCVYNPLCIYIVCVYDCGHPVGVCVSQCGHLISLFFTAC